MLLLEVSPVGVRVLCRCGAERLIANAEYRDKTGTEVECAACARVACLPDRRSRPTAVRLDRRGWKLDIPRRSWL
jgi:hypothetical protein